jgi:hypothetical protein
MKVNELVDLVTDHHGAVEFSEDNGRLIACVRLPERIGFDNVMYIAQYLEITTWYWKHNHITPLVIAGYLKEE